MVAVPDAPTGVGATPGKGSATVSWIAVAGAPPVTSYTVTPYDKAGAISAPAVAVTGNPPGASVVVAGLTNGIPYVFTVSATNDLGTSVESDASVPITPAVGTCSQCRYWDPSVDPAGATSGLCRVASPSTIPTYVAAGGRPVRPDVSPWPVVLATDWCGQFQPV